MTTTYTFFEANFATPAVTDLGSLSRSPASGGRSYTCFAAPARASSVAVLVTLVDLKQAGSSFDVTKTYAKCASAACSSPSATPLDSEIGDGARL